MSDDETKPTADVPEPPYRSAAELLGMTPHHEIAAAAGLSMSPGLREVPNSFAPADASGQPVAHVFGPGQNPVDPVAAGLYTGHVPSSQEFHAVTNTGEAAAGPRPSTYREKTGPDQVPQAAPSDNQVNPPPAPIKPQD